MVHVSRHGDRVHFEVEGWDKLWAFKTQFYDVHDPERTVVIDLDHEHYQRLVIEVANPAEVVEKLRSAIGITAPNDR